MSAVAGAGPSGGSPISTSGMRFVPREVPDLGKLAWGAGLAPSSGSTSILHGPQVEVRPGVFVEGVWDGDFAAGRFGRTENFFGSGAILDGEGAGFVSSGSTADYLYYRHDRGTSVVANSLPLLLAQLHDRLDPQFAGYEE